MLATLSDRYAEFHAEDVDTNEARSLNEVRDQDRDSKAIHEWIADHGGALPDYRFYLFGARYAYAYLGFSSMDGHFVGFLDTPAPL
jgi:hypothetical protein